MHPFQNHLIEYISGKKLMNRWSVDYFEMTQLYPKVQHILKVRYDEGSMRGLITGLGIDRPIPAVGLSIGMPKHLAPIRFPQTEKTLKLAVFKLIEVEAVEKTYFAAETDKIEHSYTEASKEDLLLKYVAFADAFSAEEKEKTGQFPDNKKIEQALRKELTKNKETLGKTKAQILPKRGKIYGLWGKRQNVKDDIVS